MEKREFWTALGIVIVVIMALVALNWCQAENNRVKPDKVFAMCNQHIEWTYAKPTNGR